MSETFFERLANVCHKLLLNNKSLMNYLKIQRGITDETIKNYNLGAFPGDLRDLFNKHKLDAKELREQNIIWNANQSQFKLYPIVIPIYNLYNQPIAIGCRTLKNDTERKKIGIPKYRHSVYKKSHHLYGLNRAVEEIRRVNKVWVVEGYFDVIMAHQKGIQNVVSASGATFSQRQLMILSRYAENICLLFDNDEPGQLNTRKILNRFSDVDGVNITCETVSGEYKDLDEYLRRGGNANLFCEKERIDFDEIKIDTLW